MNDTLVKTLSFVGGGVSVETQSVVGGGVKGALVGAVVTAYSFDTNSNGVINQLRGAVVDTAVTNSSASIVGLDLPVDTKFPLLVEFTSKASTFGLIEA